MEKINYKVILMDNIDIHKAPFLYLQDHPDNYNRTVSKALKSGKRTIGCDWDKMKNTFFSQQNINYLNNEIKRSVYNNSCEKFIIRDQKFEHVYKLMESIWDEHAQHLLSNKQLQIKILNDYVISFATETIIEEIRFRGRYIRDKFSKPVTLPDPINDSITGTKALEPTISLEYDANDFYALPSSSEGFDVYNNRVMPEDEIIMNDFRQRNKHFM